MDNELKFDLKDVTLVQAEISYIDSRSSINPFQDFCDFNCTTIYNPLPLMASPMDTVVSENNYYKFIVNKIIPCLPRNQYENDYLNKICYKEFYFQSFGLNEIEQQLKEYDNLKILNNQFFTFPNILIDVANANMIRLINVIKEIKSKFPNITLMTGNVANPQTFWQLANIGVDYIRLGIGAGNACTTSSNIGVHYPIGSLITECNKIKKQHGFYNTNIVIDGGMRNYDDIIISLGLGANYVMIGSLFNKCLESAGFNYFHNIKISNKFAKFLYEHNFEIKKKYRGMSTKSVQRKWGKDKLITSEGITKYQKVEYTLSQWTENFRDYLKSAMSYCNCKNLNDFIGNVEYIHITENARKRYEK